MSNLIEKKNKLVSELGEYFNTINTERLYTHPNQKDTKDWLAEVATILKNLDESDYSSFQQFRERLNSPDREVRKQAAKEVEEFTREKVAGYKRYDFGEVEHSSGLYVKKEIHEAFVVKEDGFSYKKLVRLMTELNSSYASGYPYSTSMLIRGILDHIPPLFGYTTFEQVANNYAWGETDKKYMKNLLDFKNSADDVLHRQISKSSDIIDMTDIAPPIYLNRLLQECLTVRDASKIINPVPPKDVQKIEKGIKITVQNNSASWANYSQRFGTWSSFQLTLEVDNYDSKKPDFVSVSMTGKTLKGEWVGNHFSFQTLGSQDVPFKIEAEDMRTVNVFIADHNYDGQPHHGKPEIDENGLEVTVTTKSGKEFVFTIPQGNIRVG